MKNRIKDIRLAKNMSQQKLADASGTTKATIMKLEKGDMGLTTSWMERLSAGLGCSPFELIGSKEIQVPVIGTVGAGGGICPIDDMPLLQAVSNAHIAKDQGARDQINCDFVAAPPDASPDVVAVRVRGDSMLPFMPDGTIVYYRQRHGNFSECLNKLCVVMLKSGEAMLKILKKSPEYGRYTLMSFNASTIDDVELEWVAKVEHVTF